MMGCVAAADDGHLAVACGNGSIVHCEILESAALTPLQIGDRVLMLPPAAPEGCGVVIGKLVTYSPSEAGRHVQIEASESVTLKCGESSIALRADGKVMIRGDEVLVRSKGTHRIRAGNVAIN